MMCPNDAGPSHRNMTVLFPIFPLGDLSLMGRNVVLTFFYTIIIIAILVFISKSLLLGVI